MKRKLEKFIRDQLSIWPEVAGRFRDLKNVSTRNLEVNGLNAVLQHNPLRIASSTAKIDEDSIRARKCFLCPENEPAEQKRLPFEGRKGRKYNIQINPFPIFPRHLVIASAVHCDQSIWHRFVDMLDMAGAFDGYTLFYNGPECGASAPDHMHFQACPRGLMPLEKEVDARIASGSLDFLSSMQDASVYHFRGFTRGVFVLRSRTSKSMAKLFYRVLDCIPEADGLKEPKFNLFSYRAEGEYRTIVTLRRAHWSHHFTSTGEDHLTMGLGCADMAGFFIVPVPEDYAKLNSGLLGEMLDEVSVSEETECAVIRKLTRRQRKVHVGILSAPTVRFEILSDGAGPQTVSVRSGKLDYHGMLYDELYFDGMTRSTMFAEPSFVLKDVTIGVGFHWERKVDQTFGGALKLIPDGDNVVAINVIGVENYLLSVISSEMKSTSSIELLKAHAVISRSWLFAQMEHRQKASAARAELPEEGMDEFITWWDHDNHSLFDVCADDHCQRYQGLGMAVGETVRKVIDSTWGQVLRYDGQLCDARFSKCCGGMMERFSSCWEDTDYPYLKAVPDTDPVSGKCFCDTSDEKILSQVLNGYDLETKDFYRWETRYTQDELSALVRKRSGIDFGEIQDLVPVERGESGRLIRLKIVGDKCSMTIGKELVIRKFLSESHLKSSAFEVERQDGSFILKGKGWGHGVGLCQIGAAVMSESGFSYRQILEHYYPGTEISSE